MYRRRCGVRAWVFATVAVLGVSTAVTERQVDAAGTSISASPSGNLTNGQAVAVNGTGFPAAQTIAIVQCVGGATDQSQCDLTNIVFASAAPDGSISSSFTVRNPITIAGSQVDCSRDTRGCIIGAADPSDIPGTLASIPITFVALPPPRAGTSALGNSPVVVGAYTPIAGSGWTPDSQLSLEACEGDGSDATKCVLVDYVTTDGAGDFDYAIYVPDVLYYFGGNTFDCLAVGHSCSLVTFATGDRSNTMTAESLAFEPPRNGTLTVATTPIDNGEPFTLTGTNWQPNAFVQLALCASPTLCGPGSDYVRADANGNFTYDVYFSPWLNNSQVCDWNGLVCSIAWNNELLYDDVNYSVVHFVPPLTPRAGTISTDAATAPELTVIGVHLSGWPANVIVEAAICATNDPGGIAHTCAAGGFIQTDPQGNGVFGIYATRYIPRPSLPDIDCSIAGACYVAAWDGRDRTVVTTTPVRVVPRPIGTVQASPSTGLEMGDSVAVTGQGWTPQSNLTVQQCLTTAPTRCNFSTYGRTDASGAFSTTIQIRDTVPAASGYWYSDCATSAGLCSIIVRDLTSGGLSLPAPLTFDALETVITSSYTPTEAAVLHAAAQQLAVSDDEYQRLASWATMYALGIAQPPAVSIVDNRGPTTVNTSYPNVEYRFVHATASKYGRTDGEFQKLSAMALAFVLGLS